MSTLSQNKDQKTKDEDDSILLKKLLKMSNDEIGNKLDNLIETDNTEEFNKYLECCSKIKKESLNNTLDLDLIINKKQYRDYPLIVSAAKKSNLEITQTLINFGVCNIYKRNHMFVIL